MVYSFFVNVILIPLFDTLIQSQQAADSVFNVAAMSGLLLAYIKMIPVTSTVS